MMGLGGLVSPRLLLAIAPMPSMSLPQIINKKDKK